MFEVTKMWFCRWWQFFLSFWWYFFFWFIPSFKHYVSRFSRSLTIFKIKAVKVAEKCNFAWLYTSWENVFSFGSSHLELSVICQPIFSISCHFNDKRCQTLRKVLFCVILWGMGKFYFSSDFDCIFFIWFVSLRTLTSMSTDFLSPLPFSR